MKRVIFSCLFAAVAGLEVFSSEAVELRLSADGALLFPGGEISFMAFCPGWKTAKLRLDDASARDAAGDSSSAVVLPFTVMGRGGKAIFAGSYEWKVESESLLKGRVRIECVADCKMQCLALSAQIPSPPEAGLGRKSLAAYRLPIYGGRSLSLAFASKMPSSAQDSRGWGGNWTYRFGNTITGGNFAKGDAAEWDFSISAPDGDSLKFITSRTYTIEKGERWVPIEHKKDVLEGSALDFSGMGLQDAPAGKYGWLKAVGGHFEFERRPGVDQRFYGANLCFSANYLPHKDADMVVERLVRCGYNAVRIHHHDDEWFASEENREKLDYLIAKAIEKGLYVTTDLYVSRNVKWRDIGIDRDGEMPKSIYKAYIGLNEKAFQDWASHSKVFLEHVNRYTGRAYKDEPGMPLISLVNEGRLSMSWEKTGKAQDPVIIAAWREFAGKGDLPQVNRSNHGHPFNRFDEWANAHVWEKGSGFVRSLGCRALLSNDNDGRWHSEGEGLTPLYDYVDNHFYVDLPSFIGTSWKLPSRCRNVNPIKNAEPKIFHRGWAKGASKPYTVTEWNFAGPGRYRAMGGMLTATLASMQEWDGLWRFAYSHSKRSIKDGAGNPGYFDCATDPLIAASDRASVCLFLRRDAQGGTFKSDRDSGTMSIVSPRTCGGFAEGGSIDAGVLSFKAGDTKDGPVPTALWVSSLDGKALEQSSRMLLVHLTDVQSDGRCFADARRDILLKNGRGCLVESCAAEVSLKVDSPENCKVYELDTSGRRMGVIPSRIVNGALCFTVSTSGSRGGRIYYEIVSGR